MKSKRLLFVLISALFLIVLAACGSEDANGNDDGANNNIENVDNANDNADGENTDGVNKEDFPIVDEEIEMSVFANKPVQNEGNDWNDILIWDEYRDLTNINVDWNTIGPDALEERRNITMGGGEDLPDAFFLSAFSNSDLLKYGEDEQFVALNDLIDEYAPNLKALMEEDPTIEKAITFPNGDIYSMPALIEDDFLSLRLGARPWISTDWLEEVNMDIPETTDEFYEFLKAVKEEDPDTIPYGGTIIDEMIEWLSGSFDVMNRGPSNTNIDLGDDEDIRFFASSDGYKEMLEYLHKLYSEELIDETIFSIEWGQFTGGASENEYASYTFYDPVDFFGEEVGEPWDSLSALEGPNGDQSYNKVASSVWDTAAFVLTNDNENPAASVRWMDHFYSDEGAELYYMGVEGETYEVEDGEPEYMDHIRNPEGDITFEQALVKQLTWLGSINGIIKADYFLGGETAPKSMEAAEKIEPFVEDEIWPGFTYTAEENKVLNSIGTDVTKYVEESRDKFISGDKNLDEWDDYVAELEKMGLDEVIEVHQQAYERYQDN